MYIKKIEIEGFKSYVRKTVVDGFDTQFNAITGLNGTGKSNILDSICFVLGITNLSCIRAQQLVDLVYKQGQAGVNKAVVTITFDNTDKGKSPMGYHVFDEIIVRRQIIVNGRNTYTINGTSHPQNKVADFFRSVGLNVNNPHFLIMQGRITKVLNMKPHEILAMLEEAAGTKIYEAKRNAAIEIIQKKENKINEINQLLDKDILPMLEKLRNDRETFIEFRKLETKIVDGERLLNAFVYYHSQNEEQRHLKSADEMTIKISDSLKKDEELKESIDHFEGEYKAMEDARSAKDKDEDADITERAAAANKDLAKVESERDALKAEQKRGLGEIKRLEKANIQDGADVEKKEKELVQLEGEGNQGQKVAEAEERVEKARALVAAVAQGMTTDQDGNAITVEAQINQTKERLSKLTTDLKKDQTREKQLRPELDEKRREVASMSKQVNDQGDELENLRKEKTKLEKALNETSFDQKQYKTLCDQQERFLFDKQQAENRLKDASSRYPNLNFHYNKQTLPSSFDPTKVLGFVVRHFSSKDEKFNLALEVTAGGQLMQVIVTEGATSKQLIDTRGALNSRTTFIPLDRVQSQPLTQQQINGAKKIARDNGEECWIALDLIEYDTHVSKAMAHIFGTTLICETKETASKITFHNEIRVRTVTLEGDSYQPSGSGSGGSRDNRNLLLPAAKTINDCTKRIQEMQKELAEVQAKLHAISPTRDRFDQANNRLTEVNDRVDFLEANARQSPVQILRTEIAELEQELAAITDRVKEGQALIKELTESVRQYEERKKNAKQFKEQEEKKAKKELKAAEDSLKALGAESEKAKEILGIRREELTTLQRQIKDQAEQIANLKKRSAEIQNIVEEKDNIVAEAKEKVQAVQKELEAFREDVRKKNEALKKLAQRIDKSKKELMTEENNRQDYKKHIEESKSMAQRFRRQHAEVLKDCAWINDIKDQLGAKGTEYDFSKDYSYENAKKEVDKMKEKKEKLARNLNVNGMNILQSAEDNVLNLQKKKEILYADKKTILETIKSLDERKEKEVIRAYETVTKEFGNIFTTLLPGAEAKLQPPPGKTALDGLEVKVGFNGKWKESLGELSGGQRSLVALSLVLAMLKFKPAPLYILDEVDAALDMAHTQNIGTMIKKHFTNSQFIIVSLKEGMFNHANVLFSTKFQDGTSQVDRFTNK